MREFSFCLRSWDCVRVRLISMRVEVEVGDY
jgi:hypothetical protein